jgi:hypothetical protein
MSGRRDIKNNPELSVNSRHSLLATATLMPLRLAVASSYWTGRIVLWSCGALSLLGLGIAALWLADWWSIFLASLLSPIIWLIVGLSPLAWTGYIILSDQEMSQLALGAFGIALSCLILWMFWKIVRKTLFAKEVATKYRDRKPPGPII